MLKCTFCAFLLHVYLFYCHFNAVLVSCFHCSHVYFLIVMRPYVLFIGFVIKVRYVHAVEIAKLVNNLKITNTLIQSFVSADNCYYLIFSFRHM